MSASTEQGVTAMTELKAVEVANLKTVQAYLAEHDPTFMEESARFTDHAAGLQLAGPDEIGAVMYDWYQVAFPGAQAHVRRLSASGETVTLEFTFVGTNEGPLAGQPPTGRQVEIDMCAIYRLAAGRIGQIDLYYDRETMDRQLGARATEAGQPRG